MYQVALVAAFMVFVLACAWSVYKAFQTAHKKEPETYGYIFAALVLGIFSVLVFQMLPLP